MSIWWIVYFQLINTNNNAKNRLVVSWEMSLPRVTPPPQVEARYVCYVVHTLWTKHLTLLIISWYPPTHHLSPPWHRDKTVGAPWSYGLPLIYQICFSFLFNCSGLGFENINFRVIKLKWDSGRQLYLWYHPQITTNRPEKHFLQNRDTYC